MLTRRTLFARLSAVALAPLVKLFPKEEAEVFHGIVSEVHFYRRSLTVAELAAYYDLPDLESIITVNAPFTVSGQPVPQEEA